MALKAWMKDGKLLMQDGKILLCEECPCGGAGVPCGFCNTDTSASQVSVTIGGGIQNGSASFCDTGACLTLNNMTWILDQVVGFPCKWQTIWAGIHCDGQQQFNVATFELVDLAGDIAGLFTLSDNNMTGGHPILQWKHIFGPATIDCAFALQSLAFYQLPSAPPLSCTGPTGDPFGIDPAEVTAL